MNLFYERIEWENYPNAKTPLDKVNLNKLDYAAKVLDERTVELHTKKADQATVLNTVQEWYLDEKTGIITITKVNGEKILFDLNIEKIPVSFILSEDGILTMKTEDGSTFTADIGSMIPVFIFENSDTISVTKDERQQSVIYIFEVKKGSITQSHLHPDYLSAISLQTQTATNAADLAKTSSITATQKAAEAKQYRDEAKQFRDEAELLSNIPTATETVAGLMAGGDNAVEDGILTLTKVTTDRTLEKSKAGGLRINRIIGKAVQNGTPTPDEPVKVEVAGESGSIEVVSCGKNLLENTISTQISTPNGLAGILVESGGNYTDENGQQWIADEIVKYADGSRKKIQRIGKAVFDGSDDEGWYFEQLAVNRFQISIPDAIKNTVRTIVLCTHGVFGTGDANGIVFLYNGKFYFYNTSIASLADFKTWLASNNITVYYELAEPIITNLTAEEVEALSKLDTFDFVTHISTDSTIEPVIEVEYGTSVVGALALGHEKDIKKLDSNKVDVEDFIIPYEVYRLSTLQTGSGIDNVTMNDVIFADGKFVASGSGKIYYSEDGIAWYTSPSSITGNVWALGYGKGKFVAVAYAGSARCYYSDDAITWTAGSISHGAILGCIAYGNGRFICLPQAPNASGVYSEDGMTWSTLGSGSISTTKTNDVIYADGKFVAVGPGMIRYSEDDGVSWTTITYDNLLSDTLNGIAYGNGMFVAVGDGGVIYISTDGGVTWVRILTQLVQENLLDITFGDGRFVATGDNFVIYTEDGINWFRTNSSSSAYKALTYGLNRYVIIGSNLAEYAEIEKVIEDTSLDDAVKDLANKINHSDINIKGQISNIVFGMLASDWKTSTEYTGYGYEYTRVVDKYYDEYPEYFLKATDGIVPSQTEKEAFECIAAMRLDISNISVPTLKFYAATKPTTNMLIVVKGVE